MLLVPDMICDSGALGVCDIACLHHVRYGGSSDMRHRFVGISLPETESALIIVHFLTDIAHSGMCVAIRYNCRCSIWIARCRVIQKRVGNVRHYSVTLVQTTELGE